MILILFLLASVTARAERKLEGIPIEGYDHCSVDPSAHLWMDADDVTVLIHNGSGPVVATGEYGNFTDGYQCVVGDSENEVFCTASGELFSMCSRAGGFMCSARVRRSSRATGADLGSTFVDVCVPGDCVGSVSGPPSCYYQGVNCPQVNQRQKLTIQRMCKNPNELCDVTYLCVGKTGPCSASTYHKLQMTEMSGCECPGCPKAIIQGGPPVDDSQSEALGMLAQLMERNDFTCNKPTVYKTACSEVGGYMCTLRVDAQIKNVVTQLTSTRGGTVDMCMWSHCAHCYNRRPWEKYGGCGESLSSLHYMANDNQHIKNALIEMFGNEQMSEATITNLEYRCKMKSFVDVGAIAGSSSGSVVALFMFFVGAVFFLKRKIRDENRAILLLGKTEEEKNKLLDEWGIGYQAKRQKEIKKAMKKHQQEEKKKELLKKKALKRAEKRRQQLEKRVARVNDKHDKKVFSANFGSAREQRLEKKRKAQRKKRLENLGCTQEEIDQVEHEEHPELAALELEDIAIKRIEESFGNIESAETRSEEFLGMGGGIFGDAQSAGSKSKFGEENGIEMTARKRIKRQQTMDNEKKEKEDEKIQTANLMNFEQGYSKNSTSEKNDETTGLLSGNNDSGSGSAGASSDFDSDTGIAEEEKKKITLPKVEVTGPSKFDAPTEDDGSSSGAGSDSGSGDESSSGSD